MIRSLVLGLLAAGPATAGCFTTEDLPARAVYSDGAALEYLDLTDDVLTYRSGQITSRLAAGLWPISSEAPGFRISYDWNAPLPLPGPEAIRDQGGEITLKARMTRQKAAPVTVSLTIRVLGEEAVTWEDCIYTSFRIHKVMTAADGRKMMDARLLFAPSAMLAISTESLDLTDDTSRVSQLKSLE
ncbi:hypothetical protein [Rhodobacter sp. 24-YEA-8]|uniref:hypothetical protein n=1 Tax=Rhodobacter sp. 24-YEA-8 TaxID=1884310 RepID=UPI000896DD9E|nr:hypothetical protein [Rhodobacter sp. 24-YEA-8]SEC02070.1 hypothetical protein SAMN05519105_1783 [Rhodobacter sp. 24-YEA-8]